MKKIYYALAIIFACNISVSAQLDRKQPPKPLPERAINFGKVENFTLKNGLKVIVVEHHKLPTVRVNLNLEIVPVKEGNKAGYLSIYGDMLRAGTKKFSKEELDDKMDYLGTDFYLGSTFVGISSLKKQLEASMDVMEELLFNATFSNQEELDKLKKQLKSSLEANDKNPDIITTRVQNVLLYGKEDPWGEYETEETIDNITLQDYKNYYNTYFKPNVAYLTIVGDITVKEARKLAEKYFNSWKSGEIKQSIPTLQKNTSGIKIAFVDLPNATQSSLNVIGLNDLKKNDAEYFPSIVGNDILGNGMSGRLFKDLREKHGWTYGAYSTLDDNYKRKGNFGAFTKVRNDVTDSAVVAIITNIKDITTKVPAKEELEMKKSEYNGNFALALEQPETVARFVRTQFIENLSTDFYKDYLKNINKVSADQIPTTLNKVIDPDNLIILVVGKGDEVLPLLEKLKYPIEYYDKFGNLVGKPAGKKSVGNVSLSNVLDAYYKAVGGNRANLEKVNSISFDGKMIIPQMADAVPMSFKFKNPNKMVTTLSLMGKTMKQGFNGTKGFSNMGPVSEELEKYKDMKGYFPELYYTEKEAVLDGIVSLDGKEAYKVIITHNNIKKTVYFDVKTGLRIKEEGALNTEAIVTEYSEYKEFNGYQFPTKIRTSTMGQNMTQIIENYTINPKLSDADFKL